MCLDIPSCNHNCKVSKTHPYFAPEYAGSTKKGEHACRGGWREDPQAPGAEVKPDEPVIEFNPRQQLSSQSQEGGFVRSVSSPPSFQSSPVGFTYLHGPPEKDWWLWEKPEPKSQMQELREMLGEGPVLDGIEPAQIQKGMFLLLPDGIDSVSAGLCLTPLLL